MQTQPDTTDTTADGRNRDMRISELMGAFDELPPDADISIMRHAANEVWTCKIRCTKKYSVAGRDKKFEVAIAKALLYFYHKYGEWLPAATGPREDV